jgi:hypothetical protein
MGEPVQANEKNSSMSDTTPPRVSATKAKRTKLPAGSTV